MTSTPRRFAPTSACAIGAEVNEYACIRTLFFAALSSFTTAVVV